MEEKLSKTDTPMEQESTEVPQTLPSSEKGSSSQELNEDLTRPEFLSQAAAPKVWTSFQEAHFSKELQSKIETLGWEKPTEIQSKCLPYTLKGRDIAGFAQTGTGKTGVFLMTIAQRLLSSKGEKRAHNQMFSLVICPTRELAIQIAEDAQGLLDKDQMKVMAIYGGTDTSAQIDQIEKNGVDLLVATPGRLIDLYKQGKLDFSKLKTFVCDEVDRMFDLGFIEDVEYILEKIPLNCQKLVFSATTNERVKELAYEYLDYPEYVSVIQDDLTVKNMEQFAYICDVTNKFKILLSLLKEHQPECALIFCNTKLAASWLQTKLTKNKHQVELITGNIPQNKRINLIRKIKEGKIKILIATDVVSRGLHISNLSHVYNFDVPEYPENYVHRVGRTARAGEKGQSYSLICDEYGGHYVAIQNLLGEKAPKPLWFHEDLANIEDLAENPFLEEAPKPRFERSPGRSQGGREDNYSRNYNNKREPYQRNRPNNHSRDRDKFPSRKPKTRHQSSHVKKTYKKVEKPPVSGIKGTVKKFLSRLFGKKKK